VATTAAIVYENSLQPYCARPSGMRLLADEAGALADARGDAPGPSAKILAAERALLGHARAGDFQGTVIRYPKLYGPRDVVPREWSVIKRVRDGRPYMLVTDGGLEISTRCAAQNAAQALLLAVDLPEVADGEAYNVADRDQYTTAQWIELVAGMLGSELEIVSIPLDIGAATHAELNPTPGRSPHLLVDATKIRRELGYEDVVTAADATRAYIEWLEANPPDLDEHPAFVDRFDYEAEDRLLAAYRRAVATILAEAERPVPTRRHPLPHPKLAGVGRDQAGR
jgi:nucleoside-diphosphate-sugar epimerase